MDGGGRLDQSMMRSGLSEVGEAGTPIDEPAFARVGATPRRRFFGMANRGLAGRWRSRLKRLPSGIGIAGSVLLLAGALGYGVVKGQHLPDLITWFKDARDTVATAAASRIAAFPRPASREVSREETLPPPGAPGGPSLLSLLATPA